MIGTVYVPSASLVPLAEALSPPAGEIQAGWPQRLAPGAFMLVEDFDADEAADHGWVWAEMRLSIILVGVPSKRAVDVAADRSAGGVIDDRMLSGWAKGVPSSSIIGLIEMADAVDCDASGTFRSGEYAALTPRSETPLGGLLGRYLEALAGRT